jgi:hypothetical protein
LAGPEDQQDRRFSNRTLAALVEAVANSYSHSELDNLLLQLDCEGCDTPRAGPPPANKMDRVRNLVNRLRSEHAPGADLVELVRLLVEEKHGGEVYTWGGDLVRPG